MLSVLALFLSAAAASAGTIPINGLVVNNNTSVKIYRAKS